MKLFEGEKKRDEPFMKLNRIDIFQVFRSIRRAVKNVLWTIEVRRATSKSSRLKWKNNAFALGGSLKGKKKENARRVAVIDERKRESAIDADCDDAAVVTNKVRMSANDKHGVGVEA